jgi:hypothetical protein
MSGDDALAQLLNGLDVPQTVVSTETGTEGEKPKKRIRRESKPVQSDILAQDAFLALGQYIDAVHACDWPVGKSTSAVGNAVIKAMEQKRLIRDKATLQRFYDAAKSIGATMTQVSRGFSRRAVDHLVRRAVKSNLQNERGDISEDSCSSGSDTDEVDLECPVCCD